MNYLNKVVSRPWAIPFTNIDLTLILAWKSNPKPCKVCYEITYPFPLASVEVWEYISNFIPLFIMDVIIYPCWYWS